MSVSLSLSLWACLSVSLCLSVCPLPLSLYLSLPPSLSLSLSSSFPLPTILPCVYNKLYSLLAVFFNHLSNILFCNCRDSYQFEYIIMCTSCAHLLLLSVNYEQMMIKRTVSLMNCVKHCEMTAWSQRTGKNLACWLLIQHYKVIVLFKGLHFLCAGAKHGFIDVPSQRWVLNALCMGFSHEIWWQGWRRGVVVRSMQHIKRCRFSGVFSSMA